MSEKLTRQQIYDRIRSSSKDSYILEEMQRLGFWESSSVPTLSETVIKREADINQELTKLLEKDRKYQNQEAMLKEMRKDRMKKAKEKRAETKALNKQKSLDKAARWKQMQLGQIIYLGKGVSGGLNSTENNEEKINQFGLPVFPSVKELAGSMNTDLTSLRYLLFHRNVSRICHYHTFEIPKKSGGKRKISAPKKRLKTLQTWVLENILNKLDTGNCAHGFVKDRSIVSNAQVHTGKDIIINIDLKDFFPSIKFKRVKSFFQFYGYSEQIATIFALICTQADTKLVTMDGVDYHVQQGERFLPQGSPASPAISNMIAYKMDRRINGLAMKYGFTYSRYADDLTFSCAKDNEKSIAALLRFVDEIVKTEGFEIHPDKTHIMRKSRQQKVTGIIVNEKPNVEREKLRKFRALLHNIEVNGWQGQQWGNASHPALAIEGYINFINMVNPAKAKQYQEAFKRIVAQHGYPTIEQKTPVVEKNVQEAKQEAIATPSKVEKKTEENKKQDTNTDWWNIFS